MEFAKGLLHLLKAPSPKIVDQIFNEVYKNRSGKISPIIVESLVSALKLNEEQAKEVSAEWVLCIFFIGVLNSFLFSPNKKTNS
jgi:hypothetical protein